MKSYLLTLLIAAGLAVSGCSSSNVEPNPEPTNHTLKQGDTFTYHEHQTDVNGQLIPGTDTTVVATVASTGITIAGRSDASMIVMPEDTLVVAGGSDSIIYILQNSVDIPDIGSIPPTWVPCALHAGSMNVYTDSTDAVLNGVAAKITITIDYQYDGMDTTTIGSEKLQGHVLEKKVSVDLYIPIAKQHYTTVVTSIYHYAPKIGFFTARSITFDSNSDQSPYPNGTTYDDLVSYQFK